MRSTRYTAMQIDETLMRIKFEQGGLAAEAVCHDDIGAAVSAVQDWALQNSAVFGALTYLPHAIPARPAQRLLSRVNNPGQLADWLMLLDFFVIRLRMARRLRAIGMTVSEPAFVLSPSFPCLDDLRCSR